MPTHELPAFLPTAKAGGFLRSFGELENRQPPLPEGRGLR